MTTGKLAGGAVTAGKIAAGSVTTGKLADDSVNSAKIVDGTVANLDLGPDSVTGDKIADATVANADLGADSVTGANIVDGTIGSAEVADESLAAVDLGPDLSTRRNSAPLQSVQMNCVPRTCTSALRPTSPTGPLTTDCTDSIRRRCPAGSARNCSVLLSTGQTTTGTARGTFPVSER